MDDQAKPAMRSHQCQNRLTLIWLQLPVEPIAGHVEDYGAKYDEERGGARPVGFSPIHDFARPTSEVQQQVSGGGERRV